MFIHRKLSSKLKELARQFPAIALLGPRQSGKTTLCKELFSDYQYINLEELDIRRFAIEDPRGFLNQFTGSPGVILDEIQNTPDLLSYLQARIDQGARQGFYILTGSHNILLNQHISQTLAGRVAIQTLLPLAIEELASSSVLPNDLFSLLFQGFYPPLYRKKISPRDWYQSYIQTYVERDVREIRNVEDLGLFQKFLKLCAGRIGQLLNLTSLSSDCGVSVGTARSWISILEMSYILFLLPPYHQNFSKRLIKSPKLYFFDPGLACHLLGIETPQAIVQHYLRGGLFESMVLADLAKRQWNRGRVPHLYFWRDKSGLEVDCLFERAAKLIPIEIKSSETVHSDFFAPLSHFCSLAGLAPDAGRIIYGGVEEQKRQSGQLLSWRSLGEADGIGEWIETPS